MTKYGLPAISRCNNMNVVRCYLALCVVVRHFKLLTGDHITWTTDYYAPNSIGGFFALSGFLAFRSYYSHGSKPRPYLVNRARRLMPMYLFIIFLCAFGLSLTSTLSYADYFTSPLFWKYIVANSLFLNFLQPSLPGVFEGEPFAMSAVNGAVWTMKVDLLLTLSVPVVHYLYTRFRLNKAYLFATIIALSVLYKSLFTYLYITTGSSIYMILGKQFFGQLSYFYVGAAICFYFDSFMKHKWTILAIILPLFIFSKQIPYFNVFLEPVVFAPLVIWVSMVGSWGYKIIKTDNVSYGIYLYHFPVIQLCILLGIKQFSPWTAFLIVTAVTTILALTAWNLIGRHFIKSRKKLTA